jgi:CRP/FNR family cyclic AMP-dependent transcriptional regulator
MSVDQECLKKNALFASVDEAVLEEFVAAGELKAFADGDIVFAEMAQSDEIYLVTRGQFSISFALADADSGLDDIIIGPNEIINAVRLFTDGPNAATGVAVGEVTVVAWKAEEMKAICERHPAVGYRIVRMAAAVFYERSLRVNRMLLDNMSWGLE